MPVLIDGKAMLCKLWLAASISAER